MNVNHYSEMVSGFRRKICDGAVYGPFSKTSDAGMIEAMGYAGFDFVILDMEHGPNGIETMGGLIRAAEISGVFPIVRVGEGDAGAIGRALDIGAGGVQVPQVRCGGDVERMLEAARFAPGGMRGVCRYVRAANYSSMDKGEYFKKANEAVLVIQLEGSEALGNLDEILGVGGFDIVFVGPYDLSQSLGVAGEVNHRLVVEKMKEIVDKCIEKGIVVGTFAEDVEAAKRWVGYGLRYMSYSVDVGLLYEASAKLLRELRGR